MKKIILGVAIGLAVASVVTATWDVARVEIAKDCEIDGTFTVNDFTYACKRIGQPKKVRDEEPVRKSGEVKA